jgi:hypothetical protein
MKYLAKDPRVTRRTGDLEGLPVLIASRNKKGAFKIAGHLTKQPDNRISHEDDVDPMDIDSSKQLFNGNRVVSRKRDRLPTRIADLWPPPAKRCPKSELLTINVSA